MKVLLAAPIADGQTWVHIKKAFEKEECEVKVCEPKNVKGLYKTALKFKPDLIMCAQKKELTEAVKQIKADKNLSSVIVLWNVDARADVFRWKELWELMKACDFHMSVSKKHVEDYNKRNIGKCVWFPQAAGRDVYKKPINISEQDKKKYSCDVSFVGNINNFLHKGRAEILDTIEKTKGISFKRFGYSGNGKVYNGEHNKVCSLSKICIGCSAFPNNGSYTSVRDYKILAAGGFLLTRKYDGVEDLFCVEEGSEEVITYSGAKDCERKILFYLEHPERRKRISEAGYQSIIKRHTYNHRVKEIIRLVNEYSNDNKLIPKVEYR